MKCDAGRCRRPAVVLVTHHENGHAYPYCDFHSHRRGRLIWRNPHHVERLWETR